MTKTNSIDEKKINEIVVAINQLRAEGIQFPCANDIARRVEQNKVNAEKALAAKKQAAAKKRAEAEKKAKRELEQINAAPQFMTAKFKDGTEIVTETKESIQKKFLEEYVKNIIARLGGMPLREVSIINRWYIGRDLNEAANEHLRSKVLAQVPFSTFWATSVQKFHRTLPFVQELHKLMKTAEEKKFPILWSHIMEAVKTNNCQLFLHWLEVAIENKLSAYDLGRKITNNADKKVKGKTRKEAYIEAVAENHQDRQNLVNKYSTIISEKEDIEPCDMEIGDFVTKLFSIVDTGFFNIRTSH